MVCCPLHTHRTSASCEASPWPRLVQVQHSVAREEEEGESDRSSSRLSSLPPQISPTSNPTSNMNTKDPRNPPQPNRQDHAKINPPPGLLQPIKHPRRQRLLRLSVRVVYLERWINVRDGVRDGAKARRETVFVEPVAQPGPRVRDSASVLDIANSALEGDGLHGTQESVCECVSASSSGVPVNGWRFTFASKTG